MTVTLNRTLGLTRFPLASDATVESLDPAKYRLRDLIKAAINAELGDVWEQFAMGQLGESPVSSEFATAADKDLVQGTAIIWPALFVHRDGEATFTQFTLSRRQRRQLWNIEWIIGPLEPGDAINAESFLTNVQNLVEEVIDKGGHPAYSLVDNEVFWQQVLFDEENGCGFYSARVVNSVHGSASFSDDGSPPVYHGCRVTVETIELSGMLSASSNAVPHTGADYKMTGDAEGDDQEDEDFDDFDPFLAFRTEEEDE